SEIKLTPARGLISIPSFTCHWFSAGTFHPFRSFPLNSSTGLPQVGSALRFMYGAFTPFQRYVSPEGVVTVPSMVLPANCPDTTRSLSPCSHCFGILKLNFPFSYLISETGLALPSVLTKLPTNVR